MPEKITLSKESGETLSSNIVSIFMIPDTGKKYIITTENAVDPHGLTVLHVSEIHDSTLIKVEDEEEWTSIKTIMRAIISGNVGSYQYLTLMEKARVDGQYSRDISVSSSAAKQMTDNYNAADKIDPTEKKKKEEEPAAAEPENSIFPQGGASPTEENEISPGIADFSAPVNPIASMQVVQAALPEDTHLTAARPAEVVATDQVAAAIQSVPVMYNQPYQQSVPMNGIIDARPQVYNTMPQQFGNMYQGGNNMKLEMIIADAQEKINESIRNMVYSIYDSVKSEVRTQQIVQQQVQSFQPQVQQPMYVNNYGVQQPMTYTQQIPVVNPYTTQGVIQPMVVQAPNDNNP